MNYYWWKNDDGDTGNVYANDSNEAERKVVEGFNVEVAVIELLEKDVKINRFTGKPF